MESEDALQCLQEPTDLQTYHIHPNTGCPMS